MHWCVWIDIPHSSSQVSTKGYEFYGVFRVKFTRHISWCKFGELLKRSHFYVSTTQCYPSMLRIDLLHIDWSCYTWHKIVRPSMGPHYQMDVSLVWRVAQSPSTYSNIWRSLASLGSKKPNTCWGYLLYSCSY